MHSNSGRAGLATVMGPLVPMAAWTDEHLSDSTDYGVNAGAKVSGLVAGMVAGADSIDDMVCCGTA